MLLLGSSVPVAITVVSVSVVVCPFVTNVVVCTTVVYRVVTSVDVTMVVEGCTIGMVEERVRERDDSGRLEVGLTVLLSDVDSETEVAAPELDSGIVTEKGRVVGEETGMEGTETGMVIETEDDVEKGIEVGLEVGTEEVGTEIEGGIDVCMDVGIEIETDEEVDVGIDVELDAGIDVESDAGIDVGADAGIDVGMDVGMDVGIEMGMEVEMEIGMEIGRVVGIDVGSEEGTDAEIFVTGIDVDVVVTALLEIVVIDGEEREDETGSAIVDEEVETVVEEREMREEVDSDCEDGGMDVGPSVDRLLLRTVVLGEAVGLIKATACETPALPDNIA